MLLDYVSDIPPPSFNYKSCILIVKSSNNNPCLSNSLISKVAIKS